jgi:hypothetical protein
MEIATLNYEFSREEILGIADRVFEFCISATGINLFPFQRKFGLRIVQSLLLDDGEEITGLFARQSGKTETVAVVSVGCSVLLPALAKVPDLASDCRISKFKDGLHVGLFAPTYETGGTMHSRMAARMGSQRMRDVCSDPDIDIDMPKGRALLTLPNGSFIHCHSAAPGTKIEGPTYHLLLLEETQDITDYKIQKSIHPMGAAVNATVVKIGTPCPVKGDFYRACTRNRKRDLGDAPDQLRSHFQYDYTHAARANPRYAAYIEKEIDRYGYDSDFFKMSYRLHWLLERGMFIAPEMIEECGIVKRVKSRVKIKGKYHHFVKPHGVANSDYTTENQVASIDFGREDSSTVITIGRVWWNNPIVVSGEDRFHTHIMNWKELSGDDHEAQYPQILSFLNNFRLGILIVDATGKGDPIYSRLANDVGIDRTREKGDIVRVLPFIFSEQSKHRGYTIFQQELRAKRFTYPAGEKVRVKRKWREWMRQMMDLEKSWRGKYMHVEAPRKRKGVESDAARDDYPDSAMMLCWAVNMLNAYEVEVGDGAIGRASRDSYRRVQGWMRRRALTRKRIVDRV